MNFRLYTVYNKHEMIKVDNQTRVVVGFKADFVTRDLGLWVECPP